VDRVVALQVDGAERAWAIAKRFNNQEGSPDTSMLMRRDADGWHLEEELSGSLSALAGSGEDLWAVGEQGVMLRRVAGKWTRVASPTQNALHALWVNGPRDAWALGAKGTALRWDGTAWRQVPTGLEDSTFWKVWGSGPSDLWAIVSPHPASPRWQDGRQVYRWDGKAWGRVELPAGALTVWGRGPGDVWVAGKSHEGRPWLWHWDGQRGAEVVLPEGTSTLEPTSLWGTADRLFVAGWRPMASGSPWSMLRWDGARWTELPVGGSPLGPPVVQGTRDGRLWLGGGDAVLRQQAP
jgi:hypothetical protein